MGNSKLITAHIPTKKYSSRNGHRITKITPHHMASVMSATDCAKYHRDCDRDVSANYYIGNNGNIVMGVPEKYRSWCSSSRWNDEQAITIEVSNSKVGGDYPISRKAWNSLVLLCKDICERHGFQLSYTGNKYGSLTRHNMFTATNCPGEYIQRNLPTLVHQVNGNDKLAVDGHVGSATVRRWQRVLGTTPDGIISGQSFYNRKRHPRVHATEYGNTVHGSSLVRAVQRKTHSTVDGHLGNETIKNWQRFVGTTQDGYFGENTAKATQKWLNSR